MLRDPNLSSETDRDDPSVPVDGVQLRLIGWNHRRKEEFARYVEAGRLQAEIPRGVVTLGVIGPRRPACPSYPPKQVRLSRFQETSSTLQDGFAPLYHPGNPEIWYKGHHRPEELTEQEALTFRMFMERQLYNVQNVVYQHEHGLVDQDVFESTVFQMRELLVDTPGGSAFWQERRHLYTEPMRSAIERAT